MIARFRVGACLLTSTGDFIKGCNVENASYGAGICAGAFASSTAGGDRP